MGITRFGVMFQHMSDLNELLLASIEHLTQLGEAGGNLWTGE